MFDQIAAIDHYALLFLLLLPTTRQQEQHMRVYCQTSNLSRTLAGNEIVDNSDVVGASLIGAARTISAFST